jgi:hypothetical protein
LHNLVLFRVKNANFSAEKFGENILKNHNIGPWPHWWHHGLAFEHKIFFQGKFFWGQNGAAGAKGGGCSNFQPWNAFERVRDINEDSTIENGSEKCGRRRFCPKTKVGFVRKLKPVLSEGSNPEVGTGSKLTNANGWNWVRTHSFRFHTANVF